MSVDKLAVIVITDGLRRDSIEAQSTPRARSAAPRVRVASPPPFCSALGHACLFSHDRNGLQSASPRTGGQQALSP